MDSLLMSTAPVSRGYADTARYYPPELGQIISVSSLGRGHRLPPGFFSPLTKQSQVGTQIHGEK